MELYALLWAVKKFDFVPNFDDKSIMINLWKVLVPVNSQIVGIKPQVSKDYSIQFSIRYKKILLPCRKHQIK